VDLGRPGRAGGRAGLIVLADKGYQGAVHAKLPYRGKNKPESQRAANRAHAKLRSTGERGERLAQDLADTAQAPLLPPGAPGNSPRPSTPWRFTRHKEDEKTRSATQTHIALALGFQAPVPGMRGLRSRVHGLGWASRPGGQGGRGDAGPDSLAAPARGLSVGKSCRDACTAVSGSRS
jgi:hypothetical protein